MERDISEEPVILMAPGDSAVVTTNSVTFWWEPVDGARSYEFHLVSPSFETAQSLVADSVSSSTRLTYQLNQGDYQWEVRAFNAGYATDYFYSSFKLDTLQQTDISSLAMTIRYPTDGSAVVGKTVTLWWEHVSGATGYDLRLVSPSFIDLQQVHLDTMIQTNKVELEIPSGSYEWELRGRNDVYFTGWSRQFFTLDSVKVKDLSETEISQILPNGSLVIGDTVDFWWEPLEGAVEYELRVVSPNFEDPEEVHLDTTLTSNEVRLILDPSAYEWRVRGKNRISQSIWTYGGFTLDADVDISDRKVKLLAPADGLTTNTKELIFWWEELKDADAYEFVLVTPSFDSATVLLMEQEIFDSQLQVILDSGNYEWGIRARNKAYKTDLTIRKLFIRGD
ncbi:MAG: hypothetical protein RIC30_13710 [Marinoscillum sp.]|uniref:hypothetical protein n=1 Tax=Marinoscillum sp. TaxID=2024838 RepID=UPI0033052388